MKKQLINYDSEKLQVIKNHMKRNDLGKMYAGEPTTQGAIDLAVEYLVSNILKTK